MIQPFVTNFSLLFLCFVFGVTFVRAAEQPKPENRPNVLLFIIDDLGRADIAVDGSHFHETPHLDALARSGVRMTDFYSACPVCSPTRAALMTGKAPQRMGITDWIKPNTGVAIPASEKTLGEAFQEQGYQTAYFGKWHLGEADDDLPTKHGFEFIEGVNRGGQPASYYAPFRRPNDASPNLNVPDFADSKAGDYLTDVITTGAINFLKQRDQQRPFLLCFGHYSIHTPIQPPAQLPAKYRAKRNQVYGTSDTPTIPAPHESVSRGRQDNPDYAAMMENLDHNIGRVLMALEELKLRDNTIVVFTSDNGGLCTMEGRKPGPTCNLPWRCGKGCNYEGGIRISTFISWPGSLKPSVCQVPAYSADLYPTLLELCGLPALPRQHRDGQSLVSALRGQPIQILHDRALAWYYPHEHSSGQRPSAAMRRGPWKLVFDLKTEKAELFHLTDDPGESTDLGTRENERTRQMTKELLSWIDETTKNP